VILGTNQQVVVFGQQPYFTAGAPPVDPMVTIGTPSTYPFTPGQHLD